jgi:hypothetical protein
MAEVKKDCGCPCSETKATPIYTYIRWATDTDGSNFSAVKDADGIKRCYQGIITTVVPMDETTEAFRSMFFQKWFNICESEVPTNIPKAFQTLPLMSITNENVGQYFWNYYLGYNAKIVLPDGDVLQFMLNIDNATDGDYGTVIIDGTIAKNSLFQMQIPENSKVIMAGLTRYSAQDDLEQNDSAQDDLDKASVVIPIVTKGSTIPLSAGSIDIWTWVYDGSTFYWTYGQYYDTIGGSKPINIKR